MSDYEVFEAGDVVLQNDITLRNAKLVYKTHGTLNAEGTNAVIYPVSIGQNLRLRYEHRMSASTRMDFYQADVVLKEIAKYTGGEAFFPRFTTQFRSIFETISHLLRNQYSLGYVSTNPKKDGKLRKIKVEVDADVNGDGKPDKLKVVHRRGYLAKKKDED